MVPAGKITDDTVDALLPLLAKGDTVIDGGNSNYKDTPAPRATVRRPWPRLRRLRHQRRRVGTQGGLQHDDRRRRNTVEALRPIFETLAPAKDQGWGRVGPVGSGHFTKMVHNGIEYGMMQAYAEGFSILKHKQEFALDLHQIGEIWRYGSVVRSWLLDLATDALGKNPNLDGIAPYVVDSGEGRWTVDAAMELERLRPGDHAVADGALPLARR